VISQVRRMSTNCTSINTRDRRGRGELRDIWGRGKGEIHGPEGINCCQGGSCNEMQRTCMCCVPHKSALLHVSALCVE
jgi:hypothetical protein